MNWIIQQSSHPDSLWQAILTGRSKPLIIEFMESVDNLPNIDYQTLLLDLKKWDAYWQQDRCNFVPVDLANFPEECCANPTDYAAEIGMHQQKIQRWTTQLQSGGQVPAVCFQAQTYNGLLRIRQGRHRIAYLRQIGCPVFAAAIAQNFVKDFEPMIYQPVKS